MQAGRESEQGGSEREDLDTDRLIERIQSGEAHLFGQVYSRYFDRVYTYLRIVLNDSPDAEDTVQQAFLKAFEALPAYERRPGQPFRAWLFTVVRNLAISHLRKEGRVDAFDPAEMVKQRERRRTSDGQQLQQLDALAWVTDVDLIMLIRRLPDAQRQALVLSHILDLDAGQIARIMERSPTAIRILQHRALAFLRDRLTALGRAPERHEKTRMRTRRPQSNILRIRRFVLK